MKKQRGVWMLLIAAFIWGSAFVAQSEGMAYLQPFTYNMARSFLGFLVLIPVVGLFGRKKASKPTFAAVFVPEKITLLGGLACGVILSFASNLQQIGISMTTAGKAGFITALYVILVPIIGIFFEKKVAPLVWVCVAMALVGFWLLCVKEDFVIATGDLYVLACACCFSLHIICVDYFMAKGADGVKLSCLQFLVVGVASLVMALATETIEFSAVLACWLPICYAGVLSSGAAYTLQILGQKECDPTIATLVMSLESVFAALSGWLVLNESLSAKELGGCVLVFAAVILSQEPWKGFQKKGQSPQ